MEWHYFTVVDTYTVLARRFGGVSIHAITVVWITGLKYLI